MSEWQDKEQVTEDIKILCEDLHFGSKAIINLGLMVYLIMWRRQCKTFFVAILALSVYFNTNRFLFNLFEEESGFWHDFNWYLSPSTQTAYILTHWLFDS